MAAKGAEVIGLVELNSKLARLAAQVGGKGTGKALFEGALVIERGVKEEIKAQSLIDTNNMRDGVEAVQQSDALSTVSTAVLYDAIHEYGGQIPITAKSRRFFWAKFKETGDGMWRALALTKNTTINIPARPHWRPGIDKGKRPATDSIEAALRAQIRSVAA